MCFFLPHDDLCRFGCRFVSSSCPETRRRRRTKSSCRQNENNKHQNNISSPTWVTGSDKERNITNHKENHILILVSERDISAIEAIYFFLISVPLLLFTVIVLPCHFTLFTHTFLFHRLFIFLVSQTSQKHYPTHFRTFLLPFSLLFLWKIFQMFKLYPQLRTVIDDESEADDLVEQSNWQNKSFPFMWTLTCLLPKGFSCLSLLFFLIRYFLEVYVPDL